jgi:hypothetical protein
VKKAREHDADARDKIPESDPGTGMIVKTLFHLIATRSSALLANRAPRGTPQALLGPRTIL